MKAKRRLKEVEDETLVTLLHLDGEIFPMDSGFWTKFEVYRVTPEPHIPHGVRYSLTLHDRYNRRVVGFDNAHAVRTAKKVTVQGRLLGIISINATRYRLMNTHRPVNYWKISGAKLKKSWGRKERLGNETKSAEHWHYSLSGL